MTGERDKASGFSWQFRLRSLFFWALVVGVALGWWLDHRRLIADATLLRIEKHVTDEHIRRLHDRLRSGR